METSNWLRIDVCPACATPGWRPAGSAQGVALRRCSGCGTLRFAAVAPPEAVYRDGYHRGANGLGWDWTHPDVRRYEMALSHSRLTWIERSRPDRGRLADVGGGLGFLAAAAAERGWQSELVEPVPDAVRFAVETFGVRAHQGGIDDLEVLGPYDVVVLSHVLEHLPDALGALRRLAAALSPGGVAYVEVPNHASVARRLLGDTWGGWQAGEHVSVLSLRTLRNLARRAGFDVVAAGTFVPLWPDLPAAASAHFLGIEQALQVVVRVRRQLLARWTTGGLAAEARAGIPASELDGPAAAAYRAVIGPLARIEEALGMGTNARVLIRPARH